MKTTKRYKMVRKMAVENKMDKIHVRFPAIGDEELGVKVISKSEFNNLVEMHKLKAHTNSQFMARVNEIGVYEIGEIVKKHTDKMIDELIGNFNVQFIDRLKEVISDGIEVTMARMRLVHAIDQSLSRHEEHMRIAAAMDLGILGPIYDGKVIRENWTQFTQKDPGSCMPGTSKDDLVDPFTGLSEKEDKFLEELARESWEEAQDYDDMEDRDEELGYIMNQGPDEADKNDSDIPF